MISQVACSSSESCEHELNIEVKMISLAIKKNREKTGLPMGITYNTPQEKSLITTMHPTPFINFPNFNFSA
jgi:hypothetical protein